MSDIDVGVGTLAGSTAAAEVTSQALQGLDKDTFLQLLVAQVKYQNPLEPTSSSDYLAQAAQYAGVEQLQNVAKGQAELRSMQMVVIATSMVGQEVTALDEFTDEVISGTVESVRFGAEPMLTIDGFEIPLSAVVTVEDSPAHDTAAKDPPAAESDNAAIQESTTTAAETPAV
ncbi:MAG: flagellar hook assembly protein FlgD [Acidimicrobiales bacterium]